MTLPYWWELCANYIVSNKILNKVDWLMRDIWEKKRDIRGQCVGAILIYHNTNSHSLAILHRSLVKAWYKLVEDIVLRIIIYCNISARVCYVNLYSELILFSKIIMNSAKLCLSQLFDSPNSGVLLTKNSITGDY